MLISNIAALLPLAAMWLIFRRCFAQTKVLFYAEIDRSKTAGSGDYSQVKTKKYAAPQHFERL
jgi:hypothetical protein